MDTISVLLLAICAGNSPVTGEFSGLRPVTRGFDVFFDLCLKSMSPYGVTLDQWFNLQVSSAGIIIAPFQGPEITKPERAYIHTLCTFPGHRDVLVDLYGGFLWVFPCCWCFFFFFCFVLLFFLFFFFCGGGGIFILFYFSSFLWGLVTLPHVSRFIVACVFSAALLRVSVFSLKISSLVVLGVSLFSHCCSTWSWVSSSWWHILHVLSGYLFL